MRLFIAITIPKEVKDYLWELKDEFKVLGKFNFVPKKNYHITLKFLGEIKEEKIDHIKQRLSEIKFNSFKTSLESLGHFNYGVLWVNSYPKDSTLQLARKVDEALIEYPNNYSFNNHITLARIKSLKNKGDFMKRLNIKIKNIKFRINSFELMKSELSKEGSKYGVLETYSLE